MKKEGSKNIFFLFFFGIFLQFFNIKIKEVIKILIKYFLKNLEFEIAIIYFQKYRSRNTIKGLIGNRFAIFL